MIAQHGYYNGHHIIVAYERILTHGAVTYNSEDDVYSIFLNQNDSWEQQRKSFDEEIFHINEDHLQQQDANKAEIEAEKRPSRKESLC